jgi:bacillithiol synthase
VPSLVDRYLAGDARAVFEGHFRDADDRRRAVKRAARSLSPRVADILEAQNAAHAPSAARLQHLAALRRGCAAVVTGQQVGLFLGPLYTVYKAASAIAVARALSAESGEPVVPVFWLQTEDHDLPEVASCQILCDACEPRALALAADASTRTSLAQLRLPEGILGCHATLREELGGLPHAEPHLDRLARHYRPGAGFGQAFAGVLAELFADEGLVLLDPRTPEFAREVAGVHARALSEAQPIARALAARIAELSRAGFVAPVHVRPDAPLSFFHAERSDGPRHRLTPSSAGFAEVGGGGTHTLQSLLGLLEADPLRFSTSALLRPIIQDTLLPTAAYVGGPGEIAYFAQLAPLYQVYGMNMPLVVPRARFVVLEARAQRLLSRHRLRVEGVGQSLDDLLSAVSDGEQGGVPPDRLASVLVTGMDSVLQETLGKLPAFHAELADAADKTRTAIHKAVSRFAQRYAAARLRRNQATVFDLQRLKALLYPEGQPQERFYGLPYFAARFGERPFLDAVLGAIDAFDPAQKELRP